MRTFYVTDPLAMKIRWKLKKHDVNAEDIMSVYSVEKPVCELLPLDEEQRQAPQVRDVHAHAKRTHARNWYICIMTLYLIVGRY
jgi:tRNA A37 threonylcarbamoyladenosine dehydratase